MQATAAPVPALVQRACACGGRCAACAGGAGARLQTRVEVGTANDPLEHEAERAAVQVMRMAPLQRPSSLSLTTLATAGATQSPPAAETDEAIETEEQQEADASAVVLGLPPPEDSDADLTRGGQPLPSRLRDFFEPRFGRSFAAVRVHDGADAERRAAAVHAAAFTYGNHIWLGRGQVLAPGHVVAHELAHVVQQRQPPRVSAPASPAALSADPGRALRRILPYWEPLDWGGDRAHAAVLPAMGRINKVFTEAPVPNANVKGADEDRYGFADFYGAGTTVGVYWKGHNQPRELPANLFGHTLRKSGNVFRGHPQKAAPRLDDATTGAISRADKAPDSILLGDLKPWYSIGAAEGPEQLDKYEAGFKLARGHFNDYQASLPTRVTPAGTQWPALTVGRFDATTMQVPKKFTFGETSGDSEKLVVKKEGVPIFSPKAKITGRLFVAKDPKFTGIWSYFWFPNKPIQARDLSGLDALGRSIQSDEIDYLRQAPLKKAPLRRSKPPGRRSSRRLQRKSADPFVFDTFKGAVDRNTARLGELKRTSEFPEFESMVHAVEVQNAMSSRVSAALPPVPVAAGTARKQFGKADLWTGPSATVIGRMRQFFGGTFVKVMDFYQSAKTRLAQRLRDRPEPAKGFGGGIAGAAVKVAFRLLKLVGGIVVQRTLQVLSDSLVSGVTAKLTALLNPDELLDKLLDPEQREAFDQKIAEFKQLREALETKAVDTVEAMVERVFGPYDRLIEGIDNVRKIVAGITQLISLVRWGARVIACLSPPAWGCLWILAEAVLEKFASLVIETCWFQRKVTPLIAGVAFIRDLPKTIAAFIIAQLKAHVLPEAVHDLLPDPGTLTAAEVKPQDVDCDEGADGAHALTPERARLMQMQERLGEEKFKAFMRLVMKAGVPSDRQLSIADIEKLEEMLLGTDTAELKRLAANYRKPRKGKVVDVFTFLERTKAPPATETDAGESVDTSSAEPGQPAPAADTREAAKDTGSEDAASGAPGEAVRVIDGDTAKTTERPATPENLERLFGLVLNPRWSHHVSNSTIYRVDVLYYEGSVEGRAAFIVRNMEVKVLAGGRSWWPSDANQRALRIRYTCLYDYMLDPANEEFLLSRDTVVWGFADKDAG